MNTNHLDAILTRLSNERSRLAAATDPKEIEMRKVWVAGVEQELDSEYKFLGLKRPTLSEVFAEMDDDALLRELLD